MATYMTFAASNTLSSFLSLTKVLSSNGFVKIPGKQSKLVKFSRGKIEATMLVHYEF